VSLAGVPSGSSARAPASQEKYVNKNALIVALLVIALVVVVYLWMNDRESKDVSIDIGQVDVPALSIPA